MCSRHKRYKGVAIPSGDCSTCWDMYFNYKPKRVEETKYMIAMHGTSHVGVLAGATYMKHFFRFLNGVAA